MNKGVRIANGLLQTTLGTLLIKNSVPSLAGYQTVYHGTSAYNKDKILEQGILASCGGNKKEGAYQFNKDRNVQENNPIKAALKTSSMAKRSKGAVFVTPDKSVAKHFASVSMHNGRVSDNGIIIKARIPVNKWKEYFVADPDQNTRLAPDKMRAARGETDVLPIEVSGSKIPKYKKVKYMFRNLPDYIQNNQKEFAIGGMHALAGAKLIQNGIMSMTR